MNSQNYSESLATVIGMLPEVEQVVITERERDGWRVESIHVLAEGGFWVSMIRDYPRHGWRVHA